MKLTINRLKLIQALNDNLRAIAPQNALPILSGIKLELTNDYLLLTSSNSEISIEISIPVILQKETIITIDKTGAVVLPATFFTNFIKKLSTDFIEMEVVNNYKTMIRSGKSEFEISGIDPEAYPLIPQVEDTQTFTLTDNQLKTIVKKTLFAVSKSDMRPVLTGVLFKLVGNQLINVSTDSHRLAEYRTQIDNNELNIDIVVPAKALLELSRIIDDNTEIQVTITNNQIMFINNNVKFISKLLDSRYPDTSRLIPQTFIFELTLDKAPFFEALDRATLFAADNQNKIVKLLLSPNQILLESHSSELGHSSELLSGHTDYTEEFVIAFSGEFLKDALRAVEADKIKIEFSGDVRPFIITTKEEKNNYLQLILPIRTY